MKFVMYFSNLNINKYKLKIELDINNLQYSRHNFSAISQINLSDIIFAS